ncbi:ornithine decarboxylase, partial [Vibrio alginolyticus]
FIPMMKDCSPLLLDLKPEDAGVIVTQSVHKQQAGFSQTSQIHKKDRHIKGQARYCNHKRFNNAFMMHASTSPFYALFSALDVNAKIHDGEAGLRLWRDAVKTGIEARKEILKSCELIRPFIPDEVEGQPWGSYDTDVIATNKKFFMFEPNASWHKFEGYGEGGKIRHLVAQINRFEKFIRDDAPLSIVLPSVYEANKERYRGYTIRQLCQEMHDMYKELNVKQLQKAMFRSEYFPQMVHKPDVATRKYFRGECNYLPLKEAVGRIAAEGALPYPPGIICVITGEVWTQQVVDYFLSLEEGINRFPGFAPEIQGVYLEDVNG